MAKSLTSRGSAPSRVRFSNRNPSFSSTPIDATLSGEVMATIRRVLGVPFGIPLPRFALELGALAIRTETELILKSRWVLPQRLLDAGFVFEYPELEGALREILRRPGG